MEPHAHAGAVAGVAERRDDLFAAALGAGRGLTLVQRHEHERLMAAAEAPRAFSDTEDGTVTVSYYRHNDPVTAVLHREDGPALVVTRADGTRSEAHYRWREHRQSGCLHREDGPARLELYADGTVAREEYYQDHQLHREDGPALIAISVAGDYTETYCQRGQPHREDGPAWTRRGADGYYSEGYCRHTVKITVKTVRP